MNDWNKQVDTFNISKGKSAPEYAKFSNRPQVNHLDENTEQKEHLGRMVRNGCELFPDQYTVKEEK